MNNLSETKLLGLVAFGAIAVFSALQVYLLTKQLDAQNEKLVNLIQKDKTQAENKSSSNDTEKLNDTLQSILIKEIQKRLAASNTAEFEIAGRKRSSGSQNKEDTNTEDGQSSNTISKSLMRQIQSKINLRGTRLFSHEGSVNVTRILLTGGPCAGKTTAMAAISQDLNQLGYKVLVVPEAATLIMQGGAMIVSSSFTEKQGLMFQKALMKLQIALEDTYVEIAQMVEDQSVVLLIDRGLLDGSAYVSKANWQALLDDMGCNTVILRDNRYDAVMHMVTAADGAETFYAGENNEARYETKEEAVDKDKKLREAYMGHQRWIMIQNRFENFEGKIRNAKEKIHYLLGHKAGSQFYKKFLLKKVPQDSFSTFQPIVSLQKQGSISTPNSISTRIPIKLPPNQHFEESQVTQQFLKHPVNDGANGRRIIETSIVRKGNNRAFTYTQKIQEQINGQIVNKKRHISAAEYIELSSQRRPDINPLKSTRLCTLHEGLYMIIDWYEFVSGQPLTCIIQVQEGELLDSIELPSYLSIGRDITDLDEFRTRTLAKQDYKFEPEKEI